MSELRLGEVVRQLRERRQLSLRAFAEKTGFSAAFLSQVENGQSSPSISSMEKIASSLGVTLAEFFSYAEAEPVLSIVRRSKRPTLNSEWSNATLEMLRDPRHPQSRLEPSLTNLQVGGSSARHPEAQNFEQFALLTEGQAELTLDNEVFTLSAGDSVTIMPGQKRRWHNPGPDVAVLLVVARVS